MSMIGPRMRKDHTILGKCTLFEGDYDGNPMQAHMQAQNVKPVHFDHWLGLFEDTLYANLPSHLAIQ